MLLSLSFGGGWCLAQPQPVLAPAPVAPPPAWVEYAPSALALPIAPRQVPTAVADYSIGDPTDDEQYQVELINRARANPPAEGVRLATSTDPELVGVYDYFGVDLNLMQQQFNQIATRPPLAINPLLTQAARRHNQDMLAHAFQSHTGSDGSNPGSRVSATGYLYSYTGENIYAYAKSGLYAHAGFEVDWGNGTGGMQVPPGHRNNLHDLNTNGQTWEIGVAVLRGTNGNVGPMLVTEELARPRVPRPYVTGVVYYDLNGNQFYDPGEGIGGAIITVAGSSQRAVSANSGGYALPVPGDGAYQATITVPGLPGYQRSVQVQNSENVKLDHLPVYAPPAITGPAQPSAGRASGYRFSAVGGAQGYDWRWVLREVIDYADGAENGLGNFVVAVSPGYSVITSQAAIEGSRSFHLTHTNPSPQSLTTTAPLRATAATTLTFQSRLGYAFSNQVARLQVSTDAGQTWQTYWSRAGTGGAGESVFTRQTVSLAGLAGKEFRLRLLYDFASGHYYPQTSVEAGWLIDDLRVGPVERLSDATIVPAGDQGTFSFTPPAEGSYVLSVRPWVGGRAFDWGPSLTVQAGAYVPLPTVRLTQWARQPDGTALVDFSLTDGSASLLTLERAANPAGPWSKADSAGLAQLGAGQYRFTLPANGQGQTYLRVRAD